jgi:hypothetical protein
MGKTNQNLVKFQLAMASKLLGRPLEEREGLAAAALLTALQEFDGLTFEIERDQQGWSAQCVNIPSIITGDTNANATDVEIDSLIKDAIFSAFGLTRLDQEALERSDVLDKLAKQVARVSRAKGRKLVKFVIAA